jgi:RNA-directed DNA polymerase
MPAVEPGSRTAGEGKCRKTRMHVREESDRGVLPMSQSNKDERLSAEIEEGRPLIEENTLQPNTRPTQSGVSVSQGLAGVRKAARDNKEMRFTALLHHVTVELLRDSFYSLKRKAAPGVDGMTWQEYETGLEGRIIDLHSRVHRGAYRAQPSRRVYIEKEDGRKRPLGVAALEDKIVQQAVAAVLNQIYEEDFLGFSYGFRPGRSQHQALDALSYALVKKKVNYVLDADIQGFFDNLDKSWLIKFVEHRVADPRVLRLIQKWLNAGVMEEGKLSETETGTPQGSVISPLLAIDSVHNYEPEFPFWVHDTNQYTCSCLRRVRFLHPFPSQRLGQTGKGRLWDTKPGIALFPGDFSDTSSSTPLLRPDWFRFAATRYYPPGTGKASMRRSMLANRRRVRWLSANNSQ